MARLYMYNDIIFMHTIAFLGLNMFVCASYYGIEIFGCIGHFFSAPHLCLSIPFVSFCVEGK